MFLKHTDVSSQCLTMLTTMMREHDLGSESRLGAYFGHILASHATQRDPHGSTAGRVAASARRHLLTEAADASVAGPAREANGASARAVSRGFRVGRKWPAAARSRGAKIRVWGQDHEISDLMIAVRAWSMRGRGNKSDREIRSSR